MYIRNDKDVKKESKMNKVLIYLGTSNLKEKVIEDVFKQIGIEINYIDDDDLENTLEKLLELPRKESKKGKREPFMFIDGDNVDEIKNLESILRDNNVKIEDHINTELYEEALKEATEKYGEEAPEFYEEMAAFFQEHDK